MKRSLLFILLCWSVMLRTPASAQTRRVTGKVMSAEDGNGIPGASVVVKGTNSGTQTDANGNYTLAVPTDGTTLVVSFVGTQTQEIALGNRSSVNVQLSADTRSLNEVVVVGYGTETKSSLTGNVAQITGTSIQNIAVPTFEQAIQGRAAGVFVESQNGKLGQGIKVRVRGSSSVSAGNEPLYVVDGIILTTDSQSSTNANTSPLADLNYNDIASIDILKDASAAAIYGSRASNGVVLITTKKGQSGKTKINFTYYTGTSQATRQRGFLNASEYVAYERRAALGGAKYDFRENINNYPSEKAAIDDYSARVESRLKRYSAGNDDYKTAAVNTNWQDQVFRKAPVSQYDLNASGGNDKTSFYVSGQYLNQNGILVGNRFQRLSTRLNLDHKINDRLSIGMNLSVARTQNNRLADDNQFSTPLQIVALSPITPVIDPRTGLLSGLLDNATGLPNSTYPVYYNGLIGIQDSHYTTVVYRTIGNLFANYQIAPGLVFRSEAGTDLLFQNEDSYYGRRTDTGKSVGGSGNNNNTNVINYTTNNFLRYDRTFARHTFDLTGGISYQQSTTSGNTVSGQGFVSDAYQTLASAATITAGSSFRNAYSFLSYFARGNYKVNNRYIVALSGRVDGSSRFGANHRYGFFPAASAGWVLSEESFLKNVKALSFLKLRVSYGLTGNAQINNYASRGLYSLTNPVSLAKYSYVGSPGQAPTQLANPDLRWESTAQADIGLEFGLLNDRLSGEVDYYQKKTTDLLLNTNVPGTTGFNTRLANIGKLENKGFELVLNSRNFVGAFTWTTNFNIATNRNRITDLNGQVIQGQDLNRAVEGQPIGVFFGREFAGADPTNGDAIYYLNTKNADGSLNRATTNDYNAAQQVVLGNPNPKFTGGLSNTFGYKGLDLTVFFQGVQGNKIYNGGGQYMSANASNGYDNQTTDQLNYWDKPGDQKMVPEPRLFFANGTNPSSRYLSDGSYLRLKTLTVGYTLPQTLSNRAKLQKVRVYVAAQNLLTITRYKGWDPEVNADYAASNITQGYDFYSAPQAKTITVGVNIGL